MLWLGLVQEFSKKYNSLNMRANVGRCIMEQLTIAYTSWTEFFIGFDCLSWTSSCYLGLTRRRKLLDYL